MSTEPIYGLNNNYIYALSGKRIVCPRPSLLATAEHIIRLLNADPLPEDRPKRYVVTRYSDGSCCVIEAARPSLPSVATFRTHHPDPLAAAQAECDRLNALANTPADAAIEMVA